ncbi:MAG TPA: metal ABC transporter ATP-binding protein [Clostridia bacterium]|nr:metal ABC transporter ATP-binding protein [Clostridia bacterium]
MIDASKVYFSYTGTHPYVLQNLDMHIQSGEYVSVVGDNGSGKSTLIRLILKFLKPTSGEVLCYAHHMGYVPQKKDVQTAGFPITVQEALVSYGKLLKLKGKQAALESLSQVGMEPYAKELIGNLSGGQYQKVLIARALMGEPDLLILDEPSTGVDIDSQRDIYAFLKKLNKERNITVVSVEHNLDAAIRNSTSIFHLSHGRGHLCSPEQYAQEYLWCKEDGTC